MVLAHLVGDGEHILPVEALPDQPMGLVRLLRVQGRQGHPAAGHHRRPGGVDHVAAHRAHVEGRAQQVGGPVGVHHLLAAQKLGHGDAQGLGQRLQQGQVGQAPARLPPAHRLVGDAQQLRQPGLGEAAALPETLDGPACDITVHTFSQPFPRSLTQGRDVCPPTLRREGAAPGYKTPPAGEKTWKDTACFRDVPPCRRRFYGAVRTAAYCPCLSFLRWIIRRKAPVPKEKIRFTRLMVAELAPVRSRISV